MNNRKVKKILILTVTAGNGHNSAANSMKNKLEELGHEVKVVDIIKEFTSKFNSWIVDKGYNIAVGHLLPIYNMFFRAYMKAPNNKGEVCDSQASVKALNGKLLKLIYDFKPDVIYSTTYYGGMALANLRRAYKLPSVNVACMLDYVVSPFWEASVGGVDFLTISNEQFRKPMMDKGFSDEQLVLTGIPIGEKFVNEIDKDVAREKLGLRKDLFTVLIFYGGGHWHGRNQVLQALLKRVKSEIQIVIVNGHNKKSKEKIDKEMKNYPKNFVIKNIGFSNEMDLIMSACDVMIGKGGGLSTTEAINKELPLIATTKLPMQEVYNIKFLQENGMGLSFKNFKQLVTELEFLRSHPEVVQEMKTKLRAIKTNGIEAIAKLIDSQPNADYFGIVTTLDYGKVNKIVNRRRKKDYKSKKKGKAVAKKVSI